jgi:hypothetical protein
MLGHKESSVAFWGKTSEIAAAGGTDSLAESVYCRPDTKNCYTPPIINTMNQVLVSEIEVAVKRKTRNGR